MRAPLGITIEVDGVWTCNITNRMWPADDADGVWPCNVVNVVWSCNNDVANGMWMDGWQPIWMGNHWCGEPRYINVDGWIAPAVDGPH